MHIGPVVVPEKPKKGSKILESQNVNNSSRLFVENAHFDETFDLKCAKWAYITLTTYSKCSKIVPEDSLALYITKFWF